MNATTRALLVMVLDPNRSREVTWLLDSPTTIAEVEKTTRQALAKLRG